MHIANPIYDVVFKYLMSDSKIARLLISSIIEEEIIDLSFKPQEYSTTIESPSLTVYRLDFCATIKTKNSSKQVIIEIQKAKFSTDIMRFRKYLGDNYAHKENQSLPIISIYFLGYSLDINAPLIQVKRHYYDVLNHHQEIAQKSDFIESLTHDSYVIQIPHLSSRFKTDIEIILSVFDQQAITSDHHILNVKEELFPEKYRHLIRRLQQAVAEPQIRKTMDIEDEILEELQNKERLIARVIHEKETALKQKDQGKKIALREKEEEKEMALKEKEQEKEVALKEKEQEKEVALKEKEQEKEIALKEKEQEKEIALKEKEQENKVALKEKEQEKDQALEAQEHALVINAYRSGLDITTIQKITQLELKIIEKIIAPQ